MVKITRKTFTKDVISGEITHRFTVEPYELCSDIVKSQIEFGDNSPEYSCILYDRETEQVYGYILTRLVDIKHPELVCADDKELLDFFMVSCGLEITHINIDKRLENSPILYLLNHVQKTFCKGNFNIGNKYIWCYLYGEFLFTTTHQSENFRGLDFNNLSRLLYLHVICAMEE